MKAKSLILEAVHETAQDMHLHGIIDKRRMGEYDLLCLKDIPTYDADKIRAIRAKWRLSQPVFAAVLNTSVSTVKQWEIGQKRPSGVSSRLLSILDKKGIEAFM